MPSCAGVAHIGGQRPLRHLAAEDHVQVAGAHKLHGHMLAAKAQAAAAGQQRRRVPPACPGSPMMRICGMENFSLKNAASPRQRGFGQLVAAVVILPLRKNGAFSSGRHAVIGFQPGFHVEAAEDAVLVRRSAYGRGNARCSCRVSSISPFSADTPDRPPATPCRPCR